MREKWVGLELPLADRDWTPVDAFTSGVLSGPRNRFLALLWGLLGRLQLQSGYAVYVSEALATLEKAAPDAASWWRANVPQLQAQNRKFLFQKTVCETVDTISDSRAIGK